VLGRLDSSPKRLFMSLFDDEKRRLTSKDHFKVFASGVFNSWARETEPAFKGNFLL
jgi:hypothetical protein